MENDTRKDHEDRPIDDEDNPDLSREDFTKTEPFREVFPDGHVVLKRKSGRPRLAHPKVHITLRLDVDVVSGIRASSKGYNARANKVLRKALMAGKL